MRQLLFVVVMTLASAGCSLAGSGEPDAVWDAPFLRDCGCLHDAADAQTLTTSCAWLLPPTGVDAPPEPGDTCAISDWEHDFTCTFVAPEEIWLCCGYSPTSGTLCQYGECPTAIGAPCCPGAQNDPYVCVDGRWAAPPV